ncbi:MAG: ureidoglycolate lyase [Acidimicrobiia bacterium]
MGSTDRRALIATPLTPRDWAPFGWLPVADTDPADAGFEYEFAWGDPHVNIISHGADEIEHTDGGWVCDRFYRHDSHTQVLLPLDVDSIVAVAPAGVELTSAADLDTVRAFTLRPLEGFALSRGTWHWGPFPVGDAPVHLWNVQGKRYAEDNRCVELAPTVHTTLEITR